MTKEIISEILKITGQLVEYKSIDGKSEEIGKCINLIEDNFSKDFLIAKYSFRNRPILVLSNTKDKEVDFLLAGHIDVVPTKHDKTFKLTEENGKIFGRGVYDMKGPLTATILAVRDFLKGNNKLKIAIIITSDEELDGLSVKYMTEKIKYKANFAVLPDGGSMKEVIIHQKGFLQIKVIVNGKSAHASEPWKSQNPIDKIMNLLNKLTKEFPNPKFKSDWKTSVNLTKIHAGEAINQIPSNAEAFFDIRYINKQSMNNVLSFIKKILDSGFNIEIIAENNPLAVEDDNIYIVKLKESIEKVTKKRVVLGKSCGTSDAVFLAENNIPTVLFMPNGQDAHQENESVEKKSLVQFYQALKEFLSVFFIEK